MRLEFAPLLGIQRELYRIPIGKERFQAYLRAMLNEGRDGVRLPPLVALNPMARGHVGELIEALFDLDAEGVASQAASEASAGLSDVTAAFSIGLVVVDDVGGGWTNRCACEYAWTVGNPASLQPGWLTAVLWSSEPASTRAVRESVQVPVYRAAYALRHGRARTLRDCMAQEGYALAGAGCASPSLDADDLDYTSQLLEPHLDEADPRTVMECLYGDEAGRTLGFTPRGLSPRAGLALALHRARSATDLKG